MPFNLKFDHTSDSGKPALCLSCRFVMNVQGSDGEQMLRCNLMGNPNRIAMRVIDCSGYVSKKGQTLHEMENSAWLLGTKKVVGLAGGRPEDETKITWSKPEDRESKPTDGAGRTPVFYGQPHD